MKFRGVSITQINQLPKYDWHERLWISQSEHAGLTHLQLILDKQRELHLQAIQIFRAANRDQQWWKHVHGGCDIWYPNLLELEGGVRFAPFHKPIQTSKCGGISLRYGKACGHSLERLNIQSHLCWILLVWFKRIPGLISLEILYYNLYSQEHCTDCHGLVQNDQFVSCYDSTYYTHVSATLQHILSQQMKINFLNQCQRMLWNNWKLLAAQNVFWQSNCH